MKMDFSKMQITFKFRLEELENMIEVYARQPMKGELEEGVRRDLRNIRLNIEEIINTEKEAAKVRPSEEDILVAASPTSVEHIK